MVRTRLTSAWAVLGSCVAATIIGCASTKKIGHGRALPTGGIPIAPATGVVPSALSRHSLAYQVAFASPYLLSVELRTQFELVIRKDGFSSASENPIDKRIALGPPDYDIDAMVVSPTKTEVFVASAAGWVRSYDIRTQEKLSEWKMGSAVSALAISADGAYLYIGTGSGVMCLRRLSDGAQLQCTSAHKGPISALAVNERVLVSASLKGELSLWSPVSMRHLHTTNSSESIADVALSNSGGRLAIARNSEAPPMDTNRSRPQDATSPDAHRVEVWELGKGELSAAPIATMKEHKGNVSSVAWLGDDLLSASWDHSIVLWNPREQRAALRIDYFAHIVRDVAVSDTSAYFAAAGWALESNDPSVLTGPLLYSN